MANFYIDDNGQMQAEQAINAFVTAAGDTDEYGLSLADAPVDSTIASWIINSIRFRYDGFIQPGGSATNGALTFTCGVKPRDYNEEINSVDDYQQIKGWPFKNGYAQRFAEPTTSRNFISYQYTWTKSKGSKPLALNRLQDVIMTVKAFNSDFEGSMSIYIRAKRGGI